MPQTLVGIVYRQTPSPEGPPNRFPVATIKPDDDSELDNPVWWQTIVGVALVKVPKATYDSWTSFAQLRAYLAALP